MNGQSTALNMGLGKMVSKKKDSVGMVLSQREGALAPLIDRNRDPTL